MQCLCIKRFAVKIEPAAEFCCQVLRIGGRTTITTEQYFLIVAECFRHFLCDLFASCNQLRVVEDLLLDPDTFGNDRTNFSTLLPMWLIVFTEFQIVYFTAK